MAESQRQGVADHLARCDDCRRWLAELIKSDAPGAGAVAADASDPLVGTLLGRYRLLERLGAGAAGLVYRARDPALERDVAIKLIREPEDPQLRPRLLREAQAMARVVHPCVVSVYDVGEAEGEVFVAMELVEAGTLGQWLSEPRPWRQVVKLFIDVGSGLAAIHRAGLLHRDVKPENILVADDGQRALVADLGLTGAVFETREGAGSAPSDGSVTQSGAVVGTPAYLAPEVIAGEPASPRSDQLAFGRSLFRALVGELPPAETIDARRALSRCNAPERLARLVLRTMDPDPGRRFPSVEAAVAQLRDSLRRRRRFRVAAALVAIAVAALALFFSASREGRDSCARAMARAGDVWGGAERESIRKRLVTLDATEGPRVFARVAAELDAYFADWKSLRRDTCEATEKGGDALVLRRAACLEDRLREMESVIATFESVTLEKAARLGTALVVLDPRTSCMGESPFVRPQPPPEIAAAVETARREIGRANADIYLGDAGAALERLAALRPGVEELGHAALLSDLAYAEGTAAYRASDYQTARARFDEAVAQGEIAGHDRSRALALSALTTMPGLSYREALDYAERARRVVSRVQARGALRANIEILIADLHYRHGEYEESKKAAQIALSELDAAEDTRAPRHSTRLASVLISLSAVEPVPARSEDHARRALELLEAAFPGEERPEMAEALVAISESLRRQGKLDEAVETLRTALGMHGRIFGEEHLHRAQALSNLCVVLTDRVVRDHGEAAAPDHQDAREAQRACTRALEIVDAHAGRADVRRSRAVYQSATGRLHLATHDHEAATRHFESALQNARDTDGNPVEIATMQVGLASSLTYLGRDLDRALELATEARETYSQAFGPEMTQELDEMIGRLRKSME